MVEPSKDVRPSGCQGGEGKRRAMTEVYVVGSGQGAALLLEAA
jgi:hypothetical protein